MQSLIRNPIFRVVGILVILYYGLFYNNQKPDSLSNRFSPDKIKNNFTDFSSKSINILANVKKAEEIKKSVENQPSQTKEQKTENE